MSYGKNDMVDKLIKHAEPSPDEGLAVVGKLFERLHDADLRYCHLKSREHLVAAVQGQSDLDVLVERRRGDDLQRILAESGYRRFQATALTAYPAVEDYLALDEATGQLVHLHLHHRLIVGEMHLKSYQLPWEEKIFATRQLDPEHRVYIPAPEMELLLLLAGDALKRRLRSRISAWFRQSSPKAEVFARDFSQLMERTEIETVTALAVGLMGSEAEATFRRILENGAQMKDREAFAPVAVHALRYHRTYASFSAALLVKVREVAWIIGGLSRRRYHWAIPLRRISPRGGIVVVFLGSHGAGKSTLGADTTAWLGKKLDVVPIYFGSGEGPASLIRKPLQILRRLVDRRAPKTTPSQRKSSWRGRVRAVAIVPWALSLSLEKRRKLRRMIRARNRGLMVICDRYPQNQIQGFNDGCLLGHLDLSRWRYLRALAAWESRPYIDAGLCPPDVVVKLVASLGVALSRRPDMGTGEIERRIAAVRELQFPQETIVAQVDADQPLELVVRAVRHLIWKEIGDATIFFNKVHS